MEIDGKSIIEYNHVKKTMTVHKLPPELQGKAIADCPLPFLFGSTADSLKRRYFIHVITPPDNRHRFGWKSFRDSSRTPLISVLPPTDHHRQDGAVRPEPHPAKREGQGRLSNSYETVINDPMRLCSRAIPSCALKPSRLAVDRRGATHHEGLSPGQRWAATTGAMEAARRRSNRFSRLPSLDNLCVGEATMRHICWPAVILLRPPVALRCRWRTKHAAAVQADAGRRAEGRSPLGPLEAVELGREDVRLPLQAVGLRRHLRAARPAEVRCSCAIKYTPRQTRRCTASTRPRRMARKCRSRAPAPNTGL